MSTVLIIGRTDGKKTKTVTTPVEAQPTFQNKQTNKKKKQEVNYYDTVGFILFSQRSSPLFSHQTNDAVSV